MATQDAVPYRRAVMLNFVLETSLNSLYMKPIASYLLILVLLCLSMACCRCCQMFCQPSMISDVGYCRSSYLREGMAVSWNWRFPEMVLFQACRNTRFKASGLRHPIFPVHASLRLNMQHIAGEVSAWIHF